ncbi:MAG TPA: MBL fold metallo-hydrolase, partial [Deltaproteobacteria bacterium]|nr:MBL fold metallo-hydrolase [Deltaproteobacteria bacterium]
MTKRKVFGIKIFFIVIIFFVIQLSVLNGFFQIQASKMSKNKLKKEHHLADGSFKNIYASSINKPFSDLIKWRWNRT